MFKINKKKIVELNSTHKLAIILDGEIVEIITCNEALCAIMTSGPVIIGYPADAPGADKIKIGWKYENDTFIQP